MKRIETVNQLTKLGRTRLSQNFFMRDFLYSEIANLHGIPNIPDDPELAIEVGTKLCTEILEPLKATFGHVVIRSAYRSSRLNQIGCALQKSKTFTEADGNIIQRKGSGGYTCADNEKCNRHSLAGHLVLLL